MGAFKKYKDTKYLFSIFRKETRLIKNAYWNELKSTVGFKKTI